MAQFNDLVFQVHAGEAESGFEAVHVFDNNYQLHIQCGPSVFTSDVTDFDLRDSASLYSTFEWKIFDGVTMLDDTNWQGGKTKADIDTEMTRIEGLDSVVTGEPGE
tara:strand:- start:46 stop:363 length:318 start_codon:yes stop_codon:yes gene_type:complete